MFNIFNIHGVRHTSLAWTIRGPHNTPTTVLVSKLCTRETLTQIFMSQIIKRNRKGRGRINLTRLVCNNKTTQPLPVYQILSKLLYQSSRFKHVKFLRKKWLKKDWLMGWQNDRQEQIITHPLFSKPGYNYIGTL